MKTAAHRRIDEGIERGPRESHYAAPPKRRTRPRHYATVPAGLDPTTVLERYLTEATTSQIAASLGTTRAALTRWLREQVPGEWKKVQVLRALARKEDGEIGLEEAQRALDLARAREQVRSSQWDLERMDPETFAQKQEVNMTVDHHVEVELALAADACALLEAIRVAPATHGAPHPLLEVESETAEVPSSDQ